MTGLTPVGSRTRTTALAVAGLAVVGLLAACGGGSSTATPAASSSAGPTGSPGPGGPGGAFAGMDMTAVRSCLEAAGVTMPAFPSGRPSFSRDPNFTGRPSFSRDPNSTAGPRGTGFPGGGRGGGFFLNDPKIRSALEACGITVPTFTPRGRPSVPTASPSS
jgi:hypothetical protein